MKSGNFSPQKSMICSKDTQQSYSLLFAKASQMRASQLFNAYSQNGQDQIWIPEWSSLPQGSLSNYQSNAHKFCSFCGLQVIDEKKAMSCYYRGTQRIYISHLKCIQESQISLSHNVSEIMLAKIMNRQLPQKGKSLAIGQKQFFITVSVLHPLSSFKYFKSNKKLIFNGRYLIWNFQQNMKSSNMFQPNIICIPTSEFKLQIKVICISDPQFQPITSRYLIDLSKIDSSSKIISVQSENSTFFKGQFQLCFKQQEKKAIIQEMNYKYKYQTSNSQPLVLFRRMQFQLDVQVSKSNLESISIKQQQFEDVPINVLTPDGDIWGGTTKSIVFDNWSPKSSQEIIINPEQFSPPKLLRKSQIDLPTYISTSSLKDYICTHNGSKQMQKTIQYMKPEEIDSIIHQLTGYFPQIVVHQYANYMFQSLTMTCSFHQRLVIIETIKKQFKNLICNKQGTFSMQQFIGFLTCEEEYTAIFSSLKGSFVQVSKDIYGTHFLRKLIKCFPLQISLQILEQIINFTTELAVDKNSVCVLKALLKVLTNAQERCQYLKRQLITLISSKLDYIIGDQFGNYLIQQCFQVFPISELGQLNQEIVKNFRQYSVGIYSSNVILKCIKTYWKNQEIFDKIDKKLKGQDISYMFRKKQGNKVLLEILEREEEFMLKIKIQNMADKLEQTKFNNQKWQRNVRNCKTDTVCSIKNFSDVFEQNYRKKGKYG